MLLIAKSYLLGWLECDPGSHAISFSTAGIRVEQSHNVTTNDRASATTVIDGLLVERPVNYQCRVSPWPLKGFILYERFNSLLSLLAKVTFAIP